MATGEHLDDFVGGVQGAHAMLGHVGAYKLVIFGQCDGPLFIAINI